MIKEGVRIDYLTKQIAKLNAIRKNMENRDNTDPRIDGITNRIAKLQREKENWEGIYKAIEDAPVIKEVVDIPTVPPAHYQQASNSIINSDFLTFMINIENAAKTGRDPKTGTWRPHVSPEGGFDTIGYGHKIKNFSELATLTGGRPTDEYIIKLLKNDLILANKLAHKQIEEMFGSKIMLNQKQEEMLTEFVFNLGNLKKFPKFVGAVLKNDMLTMKKEYKRFYSGKDKKPIELERRNKLFYDRYLSSSIKEGVGWGDSKYNLSFDFKKDRENDLIKLQPRTHNSRIRTLKDNIKFYIAYKIDDFYNRYGKEKIPKMDMSYRDLVNLTRLLIKHPTPKDFDKKNLIKMIDLSIERFSSLVDLNSFDLIISAPSKSNLNNIILSRFKLFIEDKNKVVSNAFIKNSINRVGFYMDEYKKLSPLFKKIFDNFKDKLLKDPNVEYQTKIAPINFGLRKLIHNFISLNTDKKLLKSLEKLHNGKILVIDDTVGTKGTFLEIIREIKDYKPSEIYLYAFIKDY